MQPAAARLPALPGTDAAQRAPLSGAPLQPPRRVLVAGLGGTPRLAAGLAVLLNEALGPARANEVTPDAGLPAAEALAGAPDLIVLGPGVDARTWLAAARRAAPNAARVLLGSQRDPDLVRLARRHGAMLVGQHGDGAPPVAELAAHCVRALSPAPAAPPRKRGPAPGSRNTEARRREADLARALSVGELALHYQPYVDLRSGRVLGAEALARWPHPAMGTIPPNDFIPVAEASGLILELGAWALRTAAIEAASWANRGLRISVNVSPRQVDAGVLAQQVRAALDASKLDPARLEVELTENVLIDTSAAAVAALKAVRAMGVSVALDDFGTGYASLAAVRRLPLSTLKIDRSFVSGLGSDEGDRAVVRAMVDMARALNLDLVAEGVETDAQRVALLGLGITSGQGWLFGRPAPAVALARHFKG